jgi:hypothetical protein
MESDDRTIRRLLYYCFRILAFMAGLYVINHSPFNFSQRVTSLHLTSLVAILFFDLLEVVLAWWLGPTILFLLMLLVGLIPARAGFGKSAITAKKWDELLPELVKALGGDWELQGNRWQEFGQYAAIVTGPNDERLVIVARTEMPLHPSLNSLPRHGKMQVNSRNKSFVIQVTSPSRMAREIKWRLGLLKTNPKFEIWS